MSTGTGNLREAIGLIWADGRRFVRVRLGAVLALVVTASVLMALGPVALKSVVDGFAHPGGAPALLPVTLVSLYVLSQWLAKAIGEMRGLIYARAERRMFRALSERLFAHLMQLPLRFHLSRQTGALGATLENGLQGYQIILHHLVFTFLPAAAELATIIIILTRLAQPVFLALFCGALLGYAATFVHAAISTSAAAQKASAAHLDAQAAMTDGILNYETVKYFSAERIIEERLSRALGRTETEWVGFYHRYALNGLGVATIFAAFLGATVLYAAREVQAGRMSVGGFVLVNTYVLEVVRPVEMLGYAMQGLSQGLAMLGKMLALLGEAPEPRQVQHHAESCGPGKLQFDAVSLSYRAGRSVLRELSFEIPAGKTLGIVGASGSGKTSIVRLLVRLVEPHGGRILLDGVPIVELPVAALRRSIAVVPQDTVLFNETIAYNIAFGKPGSSLEDIEEAARLAHLHEFVMSLPEKYETAVGERGVKLSGGERQRVAIARAALRRPRIYVFDEATSSLDSETEGQILRNLREISRCSTTLVIAHRLSAVMHADEIMVLHDGRMVERGPHSGLVAACGRYAALWHAQQQGLALA